MKVVVTGGHPGDPEYGCGGTIARYGDNGHEVVLLYLNEGEVEDPEGVRAHMRGMRVAEARKACDILSARPVFAPQIDGNTIVDRPHYEEYRRLLQAEAPDIVFTHWPIDNHPDHRANWLLVYDAWQKMDRSFALYYYEVTNGADTQMFVPTDYVDIGDVEELKRAACYAHASQAPEHFYAIQSAVTAFRGVECVCRHAEGFIRQFQKPGDALLPGKRHGTAQAEVINR